MNKFEAERKHIKFLEKLEEQALESGDVVIASYLYDERIKLEKKYINPTGFVTELYEDIKEHFEKQKETMQRKHFYNMALDIQEFNMFYEVLSEGEKAKISDALSEKFLMFRKILGGELNSQKISKDQNSNDKILNSMVQKYLYPVVTNYH